MVEDEILFRMRLSSLRPVRLFALAVLGSALACGAAPKKKAVAAKSDAGPSDAVIGATEPYRPASSVATMPMPDAPHFGSRIATVKEAPAWKRGTFPAASGKVDRDAATLAKSSSSSPAKKVQGFSGKLDAAAAPASHPLAVKAGHCYRLYAATKAGAVITATLLDSQSRVAAEGRPSSILPFVVAPLEGAVCFEKDDAAEIAVSLGLGEGDYALEVWSD